MNDHGKGDSEQNIDGLDISEDTSGGSDVVKPWDPKKIRITTKSFTLREIVSQIEDNDVDLSPDFQREYVWRQRQQTRLVESILLGIPLPAFYFNQSEDGSYQVVDGVQRLTTIRDFMNGDHTLSRMDLEYLKDLDGMNYRNLDSVLVRRFRATQIVVHVIEPQTPDDVKYDIFNRVNTLGSPLSAQEIRHAMSGDRSRELFRNLVEDNRFDRATEFQYWQRDANGDRVRNSARMTNRELALRFCAFRHFPIEEYRKHSSLDAFLMYFTKQVDGAEEATKIDDAEIGQLTQDFFNAMDAAEKVLGRAAFRRWPVDAERRGPINRAVFEAQANALADYPVEQLLEHKDDIVTAFREAFGEDDYTRSVTVGTGSPTRVAYRLERTKTILREVLS